MSLLKEARRNPNVNIREPILEALAKYEGDNDIFLSFTSAFTFNNDSKSEVKSGKERQHKIGINPRSSFNTPLGIYCYPIDYIVEYSNSKGMLTGPYTGSNPWKFLYVLRRNPSGIIETDAQAAPYYEKLKQIVIDDGMKKLVDDAALYAKEKNARGYLWYLAMSYASYISVDNPSRKSPVIWNGLMRKLGIKQFVDRKDEGLIHGNEPTQAVFFSTESFSVVAVYPKMTEDKELTLEGSLHVKDQILEGKFDYRKFNPFWINVMSADRMGDGYYTMVDKLAENLGALQKKTVGQMLNKKFQNGYMTKEMMKLVNKFTPVTIDRNLAYSIYRSQMPLGEIPDYLGRDLSNAEWSLIFKSYSGYSSSTDLKRQLETIEKGSKWVTKEWVTMLLGSLYDAMDHGVPLAGFVIFETMVKLCSDNNIDLDEEIKTELFLASPTLVFEKLGYSPASFKVWYRAARRNSLAMVKDIVPLAFAKVLITESRFRNSDRIDLFERLLEAGGNDEFLVRLLASENGISNAYSAIGLMHDFIIENLDRIVSINPSSLARLNINEKSEWKPSMRTLVKIMQYLSNPKNDINMYLFSLLITHKWAPKDFLVRYLDNDEIMNLLFNYCYSNREFTIIEQFPNKIVDVAQRLYKGYKFTSRHHIEYMFDNYPETKIVWTTTPNKTPFVWELMEEYPELYTNRFLIRELGDSYGTTEKLAELVVAKKINVEVFLGKGHQVAQLLMTMVEKNPRYLLSAMVDPVWQPFPTVSHLVDAGFDLDHLHALKGAKLHADIVFDFFDRMGIVVCGIFEVEPSKAAALATKIIFRTPAAIYQQLFVNELNQADLTAVQKLALDYSQQHKRTVHGLDAFAKAIHNPTPEFLEHVEVLKADLAKDPNQAF